jgi:hypothetical protein
VCAQTLCLLAKHRDATRRQPVVAPQATVNDLLTVDLDQTVITQPVERCVERPRLQPNPPFRDLFDVGDDAVAVLRPTGERGKDQKRCLLHGPLSHADNIYRSTEYVNPEIRGRLGTGDYLLR